MIHENKLIKVLGVIFVFIIIILIDFRCLLKANNRGKTMFFYFLIIIVNLTISIILISGLEIISPAMILEKLVRLIIPGKPVQ